MPERRERVDERRVHAIDVRRHEHHGVARLLDEALAGRRAGRAAPDLEDARGAAPGRRRAARGRGRARASLFVLLGRGEAARRRRRGAGRGSDTPRRATCPDRAGGSGPSRTGTRGSPAGAARAFHRWGRCGAPRRSTATAPGRASTSSPTARGAGAARRQERPDRRLELRAAHPPLEHVPQLSLRVDDVGARVAADAPRLERLRALVEEHRVRHLGRHRGRRPRAPTPPPPRGARSSGRGARATPRRARGSPPGKVRTTSPRSSRRPPCRGARRDRPSAPRGPGARAVATARRARGSAQTCGAGSA